MQIVNDFLGEVEYSEEDIVTFKEGLFGFEDLAEYVYIVNPDPAFPFGWLQSVENRETSFIVTNPFLFASDYDFELTDSIIEKLEIKEIDDITILAIVVIPDDPQNTTINLKSPVVFNKKTRQARQVILDESYDLRYKIFKADGEEAHADSI